MSGPLLRIVLWLALGVASLAPAPGAQTDAPPAALSVIVDTDMGLDDVRALFALLAADEFSVQALVTVEGSAAVGRATDHAIAVLEAMGAAGVPVLRGSAAADLTPPPWRDTANGLGGATLPPPQRITPEADWAGGLQRVLQNASGDVHYLALGPLTNLAALAQRHPDAFAKIAVLWIPVRRTPAGAIRAWNLTWDGAAARIALARARRIVLVDVGEVDQPAVTALLDSLRADSPAARWIRRLRAAGQVTGPHLFLHDELAVAALAQPGRARPADGPRFGLDELTGETLTLAPAPDGPVEVIGPAEPAAALAFLREHWEHAHHAHHGAHADPAAALDTATLLRAFHGHLGPYVVLGYRMGRLALERTGSSGHFDISAHVHCPDRPPPSCFVDGIQLGAGCTLGKRNLRVTFADGPIAVEFTARSGRRVTIRLQPEVPAEAARLVDELGVEAAGRHFLAAELERIFVLEP
ncbi:MAG: nucleoside hydrolase [Planctomycetes bacterium]|nr:nucleoside hydrolase [Planctomycetota bacterium]